MIRFRNFLPLVALLIGVAMLAAPPPARAAYAVQVFDDGVLQGGISSFVVGNTLLYGGTTTHFSITSGSGSSNNPGTQGGSNLSLSNNEQITSAFGSSGGTHTIRIELSQTNWIAPVGNPLVLSSSAGGSYVGTHAGNSLAATYQGFLDNTNTLFGQPGAASTPIQSASASGIGITVPLVFSPGTAMSLVPGGTPFSMTDVLEFTFTVQAGSGQDTANASASTMASPVPAPAGLVLALAGIPCLGLGTWLRRRLQSV